MQIPCQRPQGRCRIRSNHVMRHSYAAWMLEAGADLRWMRDQLEHASIEETEVTYGHLERDRHERRVDLDSAFTPVHTRQRRWGARGSSTRYIAGSFHGGGKGFGRLGC